MDKTYVENPSIFLCELCDFNTRNKKDYRRHILTRKHLMISKDICLPQQNPLPESFACGCGKKYTHNSGLWRHKKQCSQLSKNNVSDEPALENSFVLEQKEQRDPEPEPEPAEPPFDISVIFEILKQNKDFKELLVEQTEKMMELNKQNNDFKELLVEQNEKIIDLAGKIGNTTNNNHIKKQNNNFNLNFFLNETCKNAITLDDFVESLQINTQTAEYVGKHGFINGITNIFMNGLKELDVHMRPIHCTDAKRETMYIKGAEWEKDDETNPKMKAAITDVSNKNLKQYPVWIEENPDSKIVGTDKYEEQLKIMMGMLDIRTNKEQIIKNIAKQVVIDKN